jgi:hypothetical protein
MEIQIDPHTLVHAEERGTNPSEIIDILQNGMPFTAKYGRLGKSMVYEFNSERAGKYYKHKKVEVIYVEEHGKIMTVTVYVFYGEWSK